MNRFEGIAQIEIEAKLQQALLAQASIIERQAEIARDNLRQERILLLASVNAQRRLTHDGNTPDDIWGPEAQTLCDEFLEFAGMVATAGVQFRNTRILKAMPQLNHVNRTPFSFLRKNHTLVSTQPPDDWETRGYGIGCTRDYATNKSGRGVDIDSSRKNHDKYGYKPDYNVTLCVDGLVRANNGPVDLADLDGTLEQPLIGEFNITNSVRYVETTTYGTGDAAYHHSTREETIARVFQEMPALDGLTLMLTRHAVEIALERG